MGVRTKVLGIVISIVMVFTLMPSVSFAEDTTVEAPPIIDGVYQLDSQEDLYWFAGLVNGTLDGVQQNTSAKAALIADITVNDNVLDEYGELRSSNLTQWAPLVRYYGTFDGDGHSINGLYVDSADMYVGFIQILSGSGKVCNLTIKDSYIKGSAFVGSICGENDATITGCVNEATIVSAGQCAGGICGWNTQNTLKNCVNKGFITGTTQVGGICGRGTGSVNGCQNEGIVTGTEEVGGIAGNGTAYSSSNFGDITGNTKVGGIAGVAPGYGFSINNCSNTGFVTARSGYAGGVVAYDQCYGTIYACTNSGRITGSTAAGISSKSGVVLDGYKQYQSTIIACMNCGTIVGTSKAGQIVATDACIGGSSWCVHGGRSSCYAYGIVSAPTVTNFVSGTLCYYNSDICSAATDGEAKTTEQFASGEVTYLLNGDQSTKYWYQNLTGDEIDEYPTLDSTHKVVYAVDVFDCDGNPTTQLYRNNTATVHLPHDWNDPTWTWDGYTSAKANFVCKNYSTHTTTLTADAIIQKIPASLIENGKYICDVTVVLDGIEYSDEKIVEFPVLPTAENEAVGISLGWDEMEGAEHYVIYRKTADGEWVELAQSNDPAYLDNTVECGKVYSYSIAVSDGTVTSPYDETGTTIQAAGHSLLETPGVAPTCTEEGSITYWTCSRCGKYFSDSEGTTEITTGSWILPANGHTWDEEFTIDQEPTCTTDGSKSKHCQFCDQRTEVTVIPALGHDWDTENVVFNWSEDLSSAEATFTCKRDHSHVETLQAAVTSETTAGIITYTATVVFEDATYTDTKTVDAHDIIRLFGSNRYATAIAAADHLKEKKGVETFDTIVIASGDGFPDALSASYLAYKKDGPILLYGKTVIGMVTDYVNDNLSPGGTVYIVGGEGVIPPEVEKLINGKVVRLAGANRYATNIAVLNEAGVEREDLLVASGKGFADALSASAAKRPIFLVGNTLDKSQKDYLDKKASSMSGDIYIIGGQGAVSYDVEGTLKGYGTVKRLSGSDRYKTSMAVADEFFKGNVGTVVIANGNNFPDGLSGGPIAVTYDAPLILVVDKISGHAEDYFKAKDAYRLIIMGGTGVIADETAGRIFGGTE